MKDVLLEKTRFLYHQDKLTTENAWEILDEANRKKNLPVVQIIAEAYPRIISEAINTNFLDPEFITGSETLFFQVSHGLSKEDRKKILRKILPQIYRKMRRIEKLIQRTHYPKIIPYKPTNQWDIEKTLEKFLQSERKYLRYEDIVVITKKSDKKDVILLLDKSHSVLQYLKFIVYTSILLARNYLDHNYSIILFDIEPKTIKKINQQNYSIDRVIQELIDLDSGGKTNISKALKAAEKEFSQNYAREKILYIISDLLPTAGDYDFLHLFNKFSDIRIILTPERRTVQLIKPILSQISLMKNIKLSQIPTEEDSISKMLSQIMF